MNKVVLSRPVLICFYGFPGSGKSYVARSLQESIQLARVSADRIRHELFSQPRYDNQENAVIAHLMNYMSEEFLSSGSSVVYDINAMRLGQRRSLRELAKRHRAAYLLVWIQIDVENAFNRTQRRDRRTADDKFSAEQTKATFDNVLANMQNPKDEDYLVISGKHSFTTQKNAIIGRLYQMGLIGSSDVQDNVTKPGLVNLVPNPYAGRVDMSRRNITIT